MIGDESVARDSVGLSSMGLHIHRVSKDHYGLVALWATPEAAEDYKTEIVCNRMINVTIHEKLPIKILYRLN